MADSDADLQFLWGGTEAPPWDDALDEAVTVFGNSGGAEAAEFGVALRCLDGSHARPCNLCTASPEDPDSVELRGEASRKNGEKRLRSQVRRRLCAP